MKTLSLIILFSIISLSLGQPSPNPVRDIDRNVLRSGTEYHILPAFRGMGGGLTLASTRNDQSCPLDVAQTNLEVDRGLPVTFTPVDPKNGVIRESTDLNIIFSASSICLQSNVWMLEEYDGLNIVTGHGVRGNTGQETISNWFKIEKYQDDYTLVFCPTVCDLCGPLCDYIGVVIDENGRRRLAISETPFKIMFKNA